MRKHVKEQVQPFLLLKHWKEEVCNSRTGRREKIYLQEFGLNCFCATISKCNNSQKYFISASMKRFLSFVIVVINFQTLFVSFLAKWTITTTRTATQDKQTS